MFTPKICGRWLQFDCILDVGWNHLLVPSIYTSWWCFVWIYVNQSARSGLVHLSKHQDLWQLSETWSLSKLEKWRDRRWQNLLANISAVVFVHVMSRSVMHSLHTETFRTLFVVAEWKGHVPENGVAIFCACQISVRFGKHLYTELETFSNINMFVEPFIHVVIQLPCWGDRTRSTCMVILRMISQEKCIVWIAVIFSWPLVHPRELQGTPKRPVGIRFSLQHYEPYLW